MTEVDEILAPKDDDQIKIKEFQCFEKFIAIFVEERGIPKIFSYDIATEKFDIVEVGGGDPGIFTPMKNPDFNQTHVRFNFTSPFVFQEQYQYDHLS